MLKKKVSSLLPASQFPSLGVGRDGDPSLVDKAFFIISHPEPSLPSLPWPQDRSLQATRPQWPNRRYECVQGPRARRTMRHNGHCQNGKPSYRHWFQVLLHMKLPKPKAGRRVPLLELPLQRWGNRASKAEMLRGRPEPLVLDSY